MAKSLLSKSDFQLASTCAKKLVYKKKGYATANDTNEYMQMLAEGGYVIGKMATLLYPEGIEVEGSTAAAAQQTEVLMQQKKACIFEATFVSNGKTCRVDILEKNGNTIKIIEVKSKSFDSTIPIEKSIKELKAYIEDVAFQYLVVSELYPNHQIKAFLLMPDKSKRTNIDQLASWFNLHIPTNKESQEQPDEIIAQQKSKFVKPDVEFLYENEPKRDDYILTLQENNILSFLDVSTIVKEMQNEIRKATKNYIRILTNGITPEDYEISRACKSCEFYIDGADEHGFAECWNGLKKMPSIFELYKGGTISANSEYDKYWDELIAEQKFSFEEQDVERFRNAKGEVGATGIRQVIQYQNTINNTEWISEELKKITRTIEYPLHFIDFETYTGAVPFHKNMRPYEMLAFQWSCHTVNNIAEAPVHKEWINESSEFPNFTFAEKLMEAIGDTGTPLMWATHENTVLRAIYYQMEVHQYKNTKLKKWLERIIKDDALKLKGRLLNMDRLTIDYYFHPKMKGKTSIKKVLPAVWNENLSLHKIPYFKTYSIDAFENADRNPYDALATFHNTDDEDVMGVSNGTDAMRAYYRIQFDNSLSTIQKTEIKNRLLEYCKLDTMAMLIIWSHWSGL